MNINKVTKKIILTAVLIVSFGSYSFAAEITAQEIMDKAAIAYNYGGDDGKAKVKMTITDNSGRERIRELKMLRLDVKEGGEQKYYVYFTGPANVSGMVFMVWKNIGKDDDRWLYVPSVDLVKRLSTRDKRSSFAGSHFTYEDVSGRHPSLDEFTLVGSEKLNGKDVYVVTGIPKDKDMVEFSSFKVWVDIETFLPMKGESYDKAGLLYKTMTVEEVKVIDGITTVTRAKMVDVEQGSTVVEFSDVKYNVGLKDNIFTERYLRRPPSKWLD